MRRFCRPARLMFARHKSLLFFPSGCRAEAAIRALTYALINELSSGIQRGFIRSRERRFTSVDLTISRRNGILERSTRVPPLSEMVPTRAPNSTELGQVSFIYLFLFAFMCLFIYILFLNSRGYSTLEP